MTFELMQLNYPYDALEPDIDAKTMEIHHSKHHQGYVNKLNKALEGLNEVPLDLESLLKHLDELPEEKRTAVRNNGGGVYNHNLFFGALKQNVILDETSTLAKAINDTFGSFDSFKETFSDAAKGRFGSGWAWLILTDKGNLKITSTPNQDTPLQMGTPILGIDVWEHAYYLNYQNRRPEYIEHFFNVIDWDIIQQRYENALKSSTQ